MVRTALADAKAALDDANTRPAAPFQRLRAFVEEAQAEWLYHDGGIEERTGLLAGLVSYAAAVFFPVDCSSHDAAGVVKRLCRQAGKPYLPLRSTSLTSLIAVLHRCEHPALHVSPPTP
jgi:Uncharacterized protein conserved in bacteria (DUF2325)